jgi:hypothetical protein
MTLIVETGAGLANAESFISVSDATTYHANMGNSAWAAIATDALREAYLRRATMYMEQAYRERWAGFRQTTVQALCWPRSWVPMRDAPSGYATFPSYYPPSAIPALVANACAELALRASAGDLLADLQQGVLKEGVGPLSVEYDKATPQTVRYVAVAAMLRPFLGRSPNNLLTVRN